MEVFNMLRAESLKSKLHNASIKLSLEGLLEELSEIQLTAIKFYGLKNWYYLLNDLNEEQKAMFGVLDLTRYKRLVSRLLQ